MSGHSKWSTIKRKKEAKDEKRGGLFTKLGKAIAIAAKAGGGDQESNFKLRLAIEKAQYANMPKEKIRTAIERGAGTKSQEELDEVLYEGYGPHGIAVLVECATDNRQRTAAEMKHLFERAGGSLGGPGAVSFLFQKRGVVTVNTDKRGEEKLFEAALIAGAEDIEYDEEETQIYTKPKDLMKVAESLKSQGLSVTDTELTYQPVNFVEINERDQALKTLSFLEAIEDNDSVQRVHANFDINKEILKSLE